MKIFFVSVAVIYTINILKETFPFFEIRRYIKKLEKFISAYDSKNSYKNELKRAIARYPYIKKYTRVARIGYDLSDFSNKYNSNIICEALRNIEDEKLYHLLRAISPFHAIPGILSFPSYILSLLGFRFRWANKDFFDWFFWITNILATLSTIFSSEIKNFINSFIV